ncbi:SDR family NAD(P)-dependent oxidoreductase [Sphingobium quisquiliarum]|uniref:SDR family NAD(P)-dependent oxidoreductase n=1 Tax=Sphingobium quisquiliarum TaxID=538379 RepID=UPI001F338E1C|nr:SDR family oxidoreductase [Sphingobium quisquiliarum]
MTGGAGGIGGATARLLLERGAQIVIADIAEEKAQALARELDSEGSQVAALRFDLSDEASIQSMIAAAVQRFGRIDILVNNAALLSGEIQQVDRDVETMPTWAWDAVYTANCRGTMIMTREAIPHLCKTRGVIVNVVSSLAFQGHFMQLAYTTSKAALIQLTRSVAASHSRRGVRCNAVAPGMTLTPIVEAHFPLDMRKVLEDETLRDQLGRPEEIAEVICFLASDAARNITGEIVAADSGFTSHFPAMSRLAAVVGAPG